MCGLQASQYYKTSRLKGESQAIQYIVCGKMSEKLGKFVKQKAMCPFSAVSYFFHTQF